MAGDFVIFKGPIKDNKGQTVIAPGVMPGQTDIALESMTIWSKASSAPLRDLGVDTNPMTHNSASPLTVIPAPAGIQELGDKAAGAPLASPLARG